MDKLFDAKDIDPGIRRLIQKKVQRLVGTAGFAKDDVPDILQDLILHLLTHPFDFDERKGCLSVVVSRILDNQIVNMILARRANKRDVRRCRTSLDESIDPKDEGAKTRHDAFDMDTYLQRTGRSSRSQEELCDLAIDMARVIKPLPEPLHGIADLLRNYRKIEVAQRLNMPWSTFCDHCRRLRTILVEKKLDEYL